MYPSASILRTAGLDPGSVADRVGLDDLSQVAVRPAPAWMLRLWGDGTSAMALPWAVYIRPALLFGEPGRLGPLLLHELTHVRQWRRLGVVRFLVGYLADYLRGRLAGLGHRGAYRAIGLEREARALAGER